MGCSFMLPTPSPFCGRLTGNRGWLLSLLASPETFPAFFTKRLFKEQDVQLNLRLHPELHPPTHGEKHSHQLHTYKKHTEIFFFKIWNRGERRKRREVERKGGRKSHGRKRRAVWENQMPTPWPGRQRHSLLPCSLTVLKDSREGDNVPGKWPV